MSSDLAQGWACQHKDGRIAIESVRRMRADSMYWLGCLYAGVERPWKWGWARARAEGWRAVRVSVAPLQAEGARS